jgi:hypothetical protein
MPTTNSKEERETHTATTKKMKPRQLTTTPVVIFIGHEFGSSGGTPDFRQQQVSPWTHPFHPVMFQGSLNENERHSSLAQQAATQPPSVSVSDEHL